MEGFISILAVLVSSVVAVDFGIARAIRAIWRFDNLAFAFVCIIRSRPSQFRLQILLTKKKNYAERNTFGLFLRFITFYPSVRVFALFVTTITYCRTR